MKRYSAVLISVFLALCFSATARADMLSAVKSPLKYFDLQRELTSNDIPVPELQKEMVREIPAGFVPLRQDNRPRSAGADVPPPETQTQRDLI